MIACQNLFLCKQKSFTRQFLIQTIVKSLFHEKIVGSYILRTLKYSWQKINKFLILNYPNLSYILPPNVQYCGVLPAIMANRLVHFWNV